MRRRKYKGKKIHNFIFLYIITTIIVTTISLSKYVTTISTDSIARVAVMANSATLDIDLSEGIFPGYETIHPIVITNVDNGKVCEVTQEFIVKIESKSEDLPVDVGLYKDVACTEPLEQDENGNYKSDSFKFEADVEQSTSIYLKITWPEEEKDADLAFEIGYFVLNIVATQID